MCKAGRFNLSYKSLTSRDAHQALNELAASDPKLHAEITQRASDSVKHLTEVLSESGVCAEDDMLANFDVTEPDDTSLPLKTVVSRTVHRIPDSQPSSSSEVIDFGDEPSFLPESASTADAVSSNQASNNPATRRSGRQRVPNRRYNLLDWCRYNDDSDADA